MKRILVPVDFSSGSDAALRQALLVREKFHSKLFLLHVIHDPVEAPGFYASKKAGKKVYRNMEDAATEMMAEFVAERLGDADAKTIITSGIPATQILKTAKKQKADLIVMGTHGRSGFSRMMIGSVADKVIRAADCPVLVVRGEQGDD